MTQEVAATSQVVMGSTVLDRNSDFSFLSMV